MGDRVGVFRRIIINYHVRTRKSAKSERLDELASVARHRYPNFTAGLLQTAQYFYRFVSSDSAGDAERHALLSQRQCLRVSAHL